MVKLELRRGTELRVVELDQALTMSADSVHRANKLSAANISLAPSTSGSGWPCDVRLRIRCMHPTADLVPSRAYDKMVIEPELVRQFSHYLAGHFEQLGYGDVEVYANVWASLHGRPWQRLVDPTVDLAAQPRRLGAASWIVPLGEGDMVASIG